MIPLPRLLPLAVAVLALSACGSGNSDTGGQASGSKVLEGSIGDDMIPYEKLRSEAPPAKIEADENGPPQAGASTASAANTGPDPVVPDPMQSLAAPGSGEAETPDD